MLSIEGVLHGLFIEPIIGTLKFMMAEIRHLENREIVLSQPTKNHPISMKFGTQMQIWSSVAVT